MAWIKERSHRKLSTPGVRLALRRVAKNSRLKLIITLGPDVLGLTKWSAGDSLEFYRGVDSDTGKVQLVRGNSDGYRLRVFSAGGAHAAKNRDKLTIAVWAYDGLPTTKQRVTECTWSYDNRAATLTIDLPEWAKPKVMGFVDRPRSAKPAPDFGDRDKLLSRQ
jgi:hypothetical protein